MKKSIVSMIVISIAVLVAWGIRHTAPTFPGPQKHPVQPPALVLASGYSRPATGSQESVGQPALPPARQQEPGPDQHPGTGTISGYILDAETGDGIPDVRVTAFWDGFRSRKTSDPSLATGEYTIPNLAAGRYEIEVNIIPGYPRPRLKERKKIRVTAGKTYAKTNFYFTKGIGISGCIIDAQGVPVKDASVAVELNEQALDEYRRETATSDKDGLFTVYGIESGSEFLIQATNTTSRSAVQGPMIQSAQGTDGLVLTLKTVACSIEGTVSDHRGKGIAGVSVSTQTESRVLYSGQPGRSDTKGRFRIDGLAPGNHQVRFTHPGSGDYSEFGPAITLHPGSAINDMHLILGGDGLIISGCVSNSDRQALHNASVTCVGPVRTSTRTNKKGAFLLTGLIEGAYTLTVDHNDYSSTCLPDIVAGDEAVEVMLCDGATISGTVADAQTGRPVRNFLIATIAGRYTNAHTPQPVHSQNIVDSNGRFALGAIDPGDTTLLVNAEGYAPTTQCIENIRPGELIENVVLALQPGISVAGRVCTVSGQAIEGAAIYTSPPSAITTGIRPDSYSKDDGQFSVHSLAAEPTQIYITHHAYAPEYVAINPKHTNAITVILHPAGRVAGVVSFAGQPVSGGEVQALPVTGSHAASSTEIQADGCYRIDGLAGGQYTLRARIPAQSLSGGDDIHLSRSAYIEAGNTTTLDIHGDAGTSTLEGCVTDQGYPAASARLLCQLETAYDLQRFTTETGTDGIYRFDNVPAGVVTLTVTIQPANRPAYNQVRHFDLPEATRLRKDIAFTSSLLVHGVVTPLGSNEKGIVMACPDTLDLAQATPTPTWISHTAALAEAMAETDSNGNFILDIQDPGRITLVGVAMPVAGEASPATIRMGIVEMDIATQSPQPTEIQLR